MSRNGIMYSVAEDLHAKRKHKIKEAYSLTKKRCSFTTTTTTTTTPSSKPVHQGWVKGTVIYVWYDMIKKKKESLLQSV